MNDKVKFRNVAIYVEFENGDVHQIIAPTNHKLHAIEIIKILNNGMVPMLEEKEYFTIKEL